MEAQRDLLCYAGIPELRGRMDKVVADFDENLHRHLGIVRGPAVTSQMAHG
jgi:hypothetical protein